MLDYLSPIKTPLRSLRWPLSAKSRSWMGGTTPIASPSEMPRPYTATTRQVSTAKRYGRILRSFRPGDYSLAEVAHQCDIPYSTLVWMLNHRPHKRVTSVPGAQGKPRTVTILPGQDRSRWKKVVPLYYRPPMKTIDPTRYRNQSHVCHRVVVQEAKVCLLYTSPSPRDS